MGSHNRIDPTLRSLCFYINGETKLLYNLWISGEDNSNLPIIFA